MKKLYIGILSIVIAFWLTGCESKKDITSSSVPETTAEETTTAETTTETNEEVTEATTVPLPLETVAVEKNILEKVITDDDGTVLINASFELPVISNTDNNAIIETINQYYKKASDEWLQKLGTETKASVKENMPLDPENFTAVTIDNSFEVTYNDCGVLSVLQLEYFNAGGAHPSTSRYAQTFDLDTGKILSAQDILNGTADEVNAMVTENFVKMAAKNPENFDADAKKTIAATPYDGFYLTKTAMTFFYQTGTIAPYAAGYPEFDVEYANTDKFKITLK